MTPMILDRFTVIRADALEVLAMSMKRVVACLLALCMLFSGAALAEQPATPTDLDPTPTAAPDATPSPVPTEEPTAAPTETPTEVPTEAPAEEPTQVPTEEPTQTPEPTATAELTPAPWDETQCDHANENCLQAPECHVEGCQHIGLDDHGLDIPLCEKGRWLLNQQDALIRDQGPRKARSMRATVIDLNKADATIWRSGTYTVQGGNLRPGASLTIAENRLVVLTLNEVTLETFTIQATSQVTLSLSQVSALTALKLGKKAELTVLEGGAIAIERVEKTEQEPGQIKILGGSVRMNAEEAKGRAMQVFDAAGIRAVTVEGADYAANCPDAKGQYCLWLMPPAPGKRWAAAATDDTLAVVQEDSLPQETPATIIPGKENNLKANTVYELSGVIPSGTHLNLDEPGITLVLRDVTCTDPLIKASQPYTLYTKGDTTLGEITGSGAATILVEGTLTLHGKLPDNASISGDVVLLDEVPAGYTVYSAGSTPSRQSLTIDGQAHPLLIVGNAIALPTLTDGKSYAIDANDQAITVITVPAGQQAFRLTTAAPQVDAGNAQVFTVEGEGRYVDGFISASGVTAAATLRNVQLQSAGSVLRLDGEHLTLTLAGDNALRSTGSPAIALAGGSTVILDARGGRLLLSGQQDLTGVTLLGNIKVEPEPDTPHLSLMIRDASGNPVPNTDLTLMAGGQTWQMKTHYDGSLHLWGMENLQGGAIAAQSGDTVYTAVVMGQQADVHPGLTLSDLTCESLPNGDLRVTLSCPGAGTMGLMMLPGDAALPDTFVASATQVSLQGGQAVISGIAAGQNVTFRPYATTAQGATLNERTADGFQFGERVVYHHRGPWAPAEGSLDRAYTGRAYKLPITNLPEGAKITYTGRHLNNDGIPFLVGDYVMHVVIPEGHPDYLPGTVDLPFAITRAVLTIVPAPNQEKYEGEMDPVFDYEVKGLLDGDQLYGELWREEGEEPGNYRFVLDGFECEDWYTLRIASNAYVFTILPGEYFILPPGPVGYLFGKLTPVRQEIVKSDRRAVAVNLATKDSLVINHSVFGGIVRDKATDKPCLFIPSLSYNRELDEILLRIRTEAELNDDGGYVTDRNGDLVWGGRTMRISWTAGRRMHELGVDAVCLNNSGVGLTLRLEDLLSQEMQDYVKEQGGDLKKVYFRMEVLPQETVPEDMSALQPVTKAYEVVVYMVIDRQETDVTALLPGLTVAMEMESTAELLRAMERYNEETFAGEFTLAMKAGDDAAARMDTILVEPFLSDPLDVAWPQMMDTARYLLMPLESSGTLCTVRVPLIEPTAEPTQAPA